MTVLYLVHFAIHSLTVGVDGLITEILLNLIKNRLRDKDNTWVKNVFPLASAWISDTPSVNHSQINSEGFGLCEVMMAELEVGSVGRDAWESGFNKEELDHI